MKLCTVTYRAIIVITERLAVSGGKIVRNGGDVVDGVVAIAKILDMDTTVLRRQAGQPVVQIIAV